MSDSEIQILRDQDAGRWFCVVTRGDIKFGVELAEGIPGSGDMSVVGLEVRPRVGALTVGTLRDAPYGDAIRTARAEVERATAARRPRMFARPSDPPAAFRGDRRGRAARTDKDYALLAASYLAMGKEARRHAAATWAQDFPEGGTKRTWLNRLVRAKRFVEGERLTDAGMALVYGEDWLERFEFDEKWDNALNIATMTPGGKFWRKLQLDGKDPRAWLRAAQWAIQVDAEGQPFPKHSPQTSEECGEQE
ncbi:hypothetical protein [Aeromicrobium sp. HA]|uniref:hypothetical protein n=1 Tax=Aeromicrobium sp. HA TaxID=3009077 RepID=UPI0022AF553F|nr:hypothetical protein [Aeromicrobium sp. HA]